MKLNEMFPRLLQSGLSAFKAKTYFNFLMAFILVKFHFSSTFKRMVGKSVISTEMSKKHQIIF